MLGGRGLIISTTDLYYLADTVLPVHIVSTDEATANMAETLVNAFV